LKGIQYLSWIKNLSYTKRYKELKYPNIIG
jgi:hypothetical protein